MSSLVIPYDVAETYFENGIRYWNEASPEILQQIKEFSLDEGDVFLCGYPRSGNAWTKTIINAIYHQDDLETYRNITPSQLDNQLDYNFHGSSSLPRPSLFWTHLQYNKLPKDIKRKNNKIVYVLRDPKDVAVSYYHLHQGVIVLGPWRGSWEVFLDAFLDGSVLYGSWFDHLKSFVTHRMNSNILFVKYENLKRYTKYWIAKIAHFLEKPLDKEKIDRIAEIVDLENMKANPHLNQNNIIEFLPGHSFIRKGVVGDYRSHFTHEQFHKVQAKLQVLHRETGFEDYLV